MPDTTTVSQTELKSALRKNRNNVATECLVNQVAHPADRGSCPQRSKKKLTPVREPKKESVLTQRDAQTAIDA